MTSGLVGWGKESCLEEGREREGLQGGGVRKEEASSLFRERRKPSSEFPSSCEPWACVGRVAGAHHSFLPLACQSGDVTAFSLVGGTLHVVTQTRAQGHLVGIERQL